MGFSRWQGVLREDFGVQSCTPWLREPLTCRMSEAYVKGGRTSAFL